MTKEQEEAIERIKYLLFIYKRDDGKGYRASGDVFDTDFEAIDIFFNMLKEKDEQIAKYEKIYKEYDCYRWVKELDKKDETIDLMAEYISNLDIDEDICMKNIANTELCNEKYSNCKECIKQYFEKKAEAEGE